MMFPFLLLGAEAENFRLEILARAIARHGFGRHGFEKYVALKSERVSTVKRQLAIGTYS